MEENQNENNNEVESNDEKGNFKQWLQDNLRIIVSILIVVAIAGGVYSYSNRTNAPRMQENPDQIALEMQKDSSEEISALTETKDEASTETANMEEKKQPEEPKAAENKEEQTSSVSSSQETEGSFVETAGRGDGSTHLARRALANYLEKNPNSALTAEHKIYIEDYLRKNAAAGQKVMIGTSVEFSKDLIKNAIEKSRGLTDGQLKNLHKYAVRVPSLS